MKLSVIMPFVREYPQVVFTIRSIAEELIDRVDFELIAIDNFGPYLGKKAEPDRASSMIKGLSGKHPWLKYIAYNERLSHWQAKNVGVRASEGEILWFVDSHCVIGRDALFNMYNYYVAQHERLNGTIHLPLTYHILESKRLIYHLKANTEKGILHYTFGGYRDEPEPYEVPCMSMCGCMMTSEIYDKLGGWPSRIWIYGGGENFVNFTLSTFGMKKWIMPGRPLYHHGEKRGYNWSWDDYQKNRITANYMFGGEEWGVRYVENLGKGSKRGLYQMLLNTMEECRAHRAHIKRQQTISADEWVKQWTSEKQGKT